MPFTPPVDLPRAYRIENLLTEAEMTIAGEEDLAPGVSGWMVGANCTLSRSAERAKYGRASLRVLVTGNSGSTAWFRSSTRALVGAGELYRAFAWVHVSALRRPNVRLGIEWYDTSGTSLWTEDQYYAEPVDADVLTSNIDWQLLSFIGTAPPRAASARLRIEVDAIGAPLSAEAPADHQLLWFDDIVLTPYAIPSHGFVRLLGAHVPAYLRDLDAEQAAPNLPMLRYVDLVAATANRMLNATVAFDYIPPAESEFAFDYSSLVDLRFYPTPDIAESRWLPWLASVMGSRPFVASQLASGAGTPWYVLEADAETWNGLAALDGDGNGTTGQWSDIEQWNPRPREQAVSVIDAIRSRGTGLLAGTREGLRRAARMGIVGFDAGARVTRSGNVVTAELDRSALDASVNDWIEIYDPETGDESLIGYSEIDSISASGTTITFTLAGDDVATPVNVFITNKYTELQDYIYSAYEVAVGSSSSGPDLSIYASGGERFPMDLALPAIVTVSNTTTTYDAPDYSIAVSVDRRTVTITSNVGTFPLSAASGNAVFACEDIWCTAVATLESQTPDPGTVLAAIADAVPAGCSVTHRYTV